MVYPKDAPAGQKAAISRLSRVLAESRAARVGETTVVSTQVHIQDMRTPEDISAVLESDAGAVFYHRQKPGEVLHIDVFHSPGLVDPKYVAKNILAALSGLRLGADGGFQSSMETFIPYIDVQTAMGGGRLDGLLCYGQEQGVRAAHRTHVHLTALVAPEITAALFTLIAAVESAILDSGLELRKVRRVKTVHGNAPADMSGYQATSDSLLRQIPGSNSEGGQASPFRTEALARQLARDVGSAEDSKRVLEQLARGMKAAEFSKMRFGPDRNSDEVRNSLARSNLMKFDGQKYTLTGEGAGVLSFMNEHEHEIDLYLKRLIWSLPRKKVPRGERKGRKTEPGQNRGRGPVLPQRDGEPPGSLAAAETVIAASIRNIMDVAARNGGAGASGTDATGVDAPGSVVSTSFLPKDLRFSHTRDRKGGPVILLLDASASMAGRRMRAAKELARHLVLATKDKVSIVAFQDADVKVVCPFTRNIKKVEAGLSEIQAAGLTPLAKGLEKALELASRSLRKPLVLCVTDGIPTVASHSVSPIDDALLAASALSKHGIRLGCIGLEPNSGFLRQMVETSKGTLYVVEELEASTMVAIARREAVK